VRDPTGVLRGSEPASSSPALAPAANAPTSLLPAPGSDAAASYVQGFRTGVMAAKFNVPGVTTLQQLEQAAVQQQPTPVVLPQNPVPQPEEVPHSQVRMEESGTDFENQNVFEVDPNLGENVEFQHSVSSILDELPDVQTPKIMGHSLAPRKAQPEPKKPKHSRKSEIKRPRRDYSPKAKQPAPTSTPKPPTPKATSSTTTISSTHRCTPQRHAAKQAQELIKSSISFQKPETYS